jgi:hypothetical protein
MLRSAWCLLAVLAAGCDDAWKADVTEYYLLRCEYQELCATTTAGLDCEAYAAQYEARPDPCMIYDDYYGPACLQQLQEYVDILAEDPETCPEGIDGGAPACTQAFTEIAQGTCNPAE